MIQNLSMPPVVPAATASKSAASQPAAAPSQTTARTSEKTVDKLVRYTNYGAGAAGSTAATLAAPYQIQKAAPGVIQATHRLADFFQGAAQTRPLFSKGSQALATGALQAAKGTEIVSKLSTSLMQTPVIGRITSPRVSETMTRKVLPVANAVGTSLGVADNSLRFVRAREQGNSAGQVVAGFQVGLNALSGITGFLPGKAQWVSAGAGFASLGLEMVHQFGGVGK
jgi:hypothetical protein